MVDALAAGGLAFESHSGASTGTWIRVQESKSEHGYQSVDAEFSGAEVFQWGTCWARNFFPLNLPLQDPPLNCPFPVVGTGVDPVTPRFSAGPGTDSVWSVRLAVPAKILFTAPLSEKSGVRYHPPFYLVSRSCGHVVGTKLHTGISDCRSDSRTDILSRSANSRRELTACKLVMNPSTRPLPNPL
jgi:hypothetical protein